MESMKRLRRFVCVMLIVLLIAGTLILAGTETEADKGALVMTEMMRQALVLAGCDMTEFDEENPTFTERRLMEATAYLENALKAKYPDETFELTACVRRGLNQEYDEFVLAPSGAPDQTFAARVSGIPGSFSCTESYFGIARIEDYEALVRNALTAAEPDITVLSTIDYQFSERFTQDTPIGEALNEEGFFAYTWLLLREDGRPFEARVEALRKAVGEQNSAGDYTVYLLTEEYAGIDSKADAFRFIPGHTQDHPVYVQSSRFLQ